MKEESETKMTAGQPAQEESLSAVITEKPGEMIGRYKLREKIGEGGWGVVYVAEQEEPVRRRVALKVIKLGMDTRAVVARFEAERQALAMMDHPNIAKVLDVGSTQTGRPFFVMELVRGIKITEYCDQNNLSTRERLELFIKICQAVQHAHQKGIVHRDLKPSNILVTLHDGVPVPKVIDFGIAKATEGRLTDLTVYTELHQMIGTPAYMSPEQAEMSGLDIDTRSDIYSLGVLLYELLTGKTPFDARELVDSGLDGMRRTIREKEPVRPSTRLAAMRQEESTDIARHRQSDLPRLIHLLRGDLDWIVMKTLEKDRTRRYDTANGLVMDLRRHLQNEPVTARPPSQIYKFQKFVARHKVGVLAGCVVLLAIFASILGQSVSLVHARQAQQAAKQQADVAHQARLEETAQRRKAQEANIRESDQRQRAESNARRAEQSELNGRRLLYAAEMNLAQQALKANNLGRARRLLDRHRPAEGKEDLRGWEWRYLWQQCQNDALAILSQRADRAFSVSFSPDGGRLAVAYLDARVELWDVAGRRLTKVLFEGPSQVPGHVAFSPQADLLASTAEAGVIKLHDLSAGRASVLHQQRGLVRDLSFTPDGKVLTALVGIGAGGPSALVFDVKEGTLISSNRIAGGGGMHFLNARLSPDHQRLYFSQITSEAPTVQCISLPDGRLLWKSQPLEDYSFTAMDLSPDGRSLVTGSGYEDTSIRVWNAADGKLITTLEGHSGWVCQLAYSTDGAFLASSSADQTVRLWDTTTWSEAATLRGHGDEVHSVAFSRNGQYLASGSKDGVVMLWDARARRPPGGRQTLPPYVRFSQFVPGSQTVVAVTTNSAAVLIDLATFQERGVNVPLNREYVSAIGSFFGTYDGTNAFRFYQLLPIGPGLLAEFPVPTNFVRQVAYSPEKKWLAWADGTRTIHLETLGQPEQRVELTADQEGIVPLQFGGENRFLLALATNGTSRAWDLGTRKLILTTQRSEYIGFSMLAAKGHALAVYAGTAVAPEIELWNLLEPEAPIVRIPQRGSLTRGAFSPDGKILAVPSTAGFVVLYDTLKREKISVLHGHMQAAHGVAFSPEGTRLVSTSGGKEAVKLWDPITGQELLTLSGKGPLLAAVSFSDDGNTLLVGSSGRGGFNQFWRAPSWQEIREAEARNASWPRAE